MKCISAFAGLTVATAGPDPNYNDLWQIFKHDFEKIYRDGEEFRRFDIFLRNIDKINAENAKDRSYKLGLNQFADLTADEFQDAYIGGYVPSLRAPGLTASPWVAPNVSVPDAVDWVSKGGVTPVKNQARCGSCWAFSTTGAVEGAYFVASKKLVSLSEEELVQCDMVDNGCHGGLMDNGFRFAEKGLCKEDDYPYTSGPGTRGTCKRTCSPAVMVSGLTDVRHNDENDLLKAVAQQPVSVAIEADKTAFQLYRNGILDNPACGQKLDHGVLAVGFGTDAGTLYWKVKNSWGATWGEKGYIRMVRGKNQCGIAAQASFPTGAKAAPPSPPGPPGPQPTPPPPPTPSSCTAGCQAACTKAFGGPCCRQTGMRCSCCRAGQTCTILGGCSGGSDCNEVTLGSNGSSIVV